MSRVHRQGFLKPCPFLMQCCPKLRPCTQRLNLLMISSTIDLDSSFTFYAEENCEIAPQFVEVFHESLPLFLIPNPVSDRLPVNLISCQMFLQLLVALTQLLETCSCHQIQHELICFFNETKCLSLDISCFLCSTVNNI